MAAVETFVVRLARPAADAGDGAAGELHGVVDHLRSKQSRAFRGNDELLRFLVEGLAAREPPASSQPVKGASRWSGH